MSQEKVNKFSNDEITIDGGQAFVLMPRNALVHCHKFTNRAKNPGLK